MTNHGSPFSKKFALYFLFALCVLVVLLCFQFTKNCTALSQSDSRNVLMCIIKYNTLSLSAPRSFTTLTTNRQGRSGSIQTFTVPKTTQYRIRAWGARGGTHSTNYGSYPGTYYGGKRAYKEGFFTLNKGTVVNIVVGQRGGDSVEVKGGQPTILTAAQLGLSVEDNAGTGGG